MKGLVFIPVVAAVFSRRNPQTQELEILLFQRAQDDVGGGHWEFPGGKVELGESDSQALKRELEEELAVFVQVQELLGKSHFQSPSGKDFELRVYFVEGPVHQILLREHQAKKWVTSQTVVEDEVSEGDRPLLVDCFKRLEKIYGQS